MKLQIRFLTILILSSLTCFLLYPSSPTFAACRVVIELDSFAGPQEEEEDPFAEPQEEEEDPFAEPDVPPQEPMEPQEEEDPFAPQEEEDPFAEPDDPKEPMDPQEEEDPFAVPKSDPKPVQPKSDPKPVQPKSDPKPTEPADQPKTEPIKPDTAPKATEPKTNSSPSLSPAGSGNKDAGSTTRKALESETAKSGSDSKSSGSSTKQPAGPPTTNPNVGSATRDSGSGLKPDNLNTGPDLNVGATDAAYENFKNIVREIRTNEQRINQLVISMPVGFPERRKQQQNQVGLLRQRNIDIKRQLLPLAKESFDKFPNTQPEVNNFLLQQIQVRLTGRSYATSPFNPFIALTECSKMIDGGVRSPMLHSFAYRSRYVLCDFPQAGRHAQKAVMLGHPIDQRLFNDLKAINKVYEEEKQLRMQDAANGNPQVRIEMDCGTMIVELFEDQAPNTVANFVTLVQDGFYNGLSFFQVNPTEVAMTGSPTNDGKGGPGYLIKSEAGVEGARRHFTGTLSMLSAGDHTSGSIFLITKQPRLQYDGQITGFGRVIEGLENLYNVNVINRTAALSANDPTVATQITRMTVVRKRNHEYVPEKITLPSSGG